ncbi:MAG: IPT/TIG domain-containing protein [Bacteroidales bacterium]|jgi:hypothetical protein|nr:IPT/TIG domain-containing protein [Bacteroidales bacterium]
MHKLREYCILSVLCSAGVFVACEDSGSQQALEQGPAYNPSEPVELTRFYPDSGGMATQIILEGLNFGNDPGQVRVYFNKKRAAVVQTTGDMIYAITPRQPGDTCTISVAVGAGATPGKDSVTYKNTFEYTTVIGLTTVLGQPGANLDQGGTLSEARIYKPQFIGVDVEDNVYVTSEGYGLYLVNETANTVMVLLTGSTYNAPTIDKTTGRHVLVPANSGYPYLRFDPDDGYSSRKYNPVRVGNADLGLSETGWNFSYKHQFASNADDGMIYFGSRTDSYIVRIDPKTREMKPIFDLRSKQSNYFSMFHPHEHNMLYMSARNRHCIYTFNLQTSELTLYAGEENTPGHSDGERLTARFSEPTQVDFDDDGNLFIADKNNHVIRKINPEGLVTTVIGIPGTTGHIDGTADYALLNLPWGVAVSKDGSVYISDYNNQCIRKLSIQ